MDGFGERDGLWREMGWGSDMCFGEGDGFGV